MLPITGNVKEGETNGIWYYDTPLSGGTGTPTTASIPAFKMSETPITQAQFDYVMEINPAYFQCSNNPDYAPSSAKPVEMVSWYGAITYCNKLSLKEGKTPCYSVKVGSTTEVNWENITYAEIPDNSSADADWDAATCNFSANGYRLPTEWEWEYAARGGTGNAHPVFSGSNYIGGYNVTEAYDELCRVAWFEYNNNMSLCGTLGIYGTKDVKMKGVNFFSLYDMNGNVWEWCWNWSNDGSGTPFGTPTGTVASSGSDNRVLRGGDWNDDISNCRVSDRYGTYPYNGDIDYGFRVVCK
jgi:formylglycine-generating enzyme required for sulfatase activity